MTLSPEARALDLANTILDRGMVPIISTECRALIASAIREAENEALERARKLALNQVKFASDDWGQGHSVAAAGIAQAIRALKSPIPKEPA